MSIAPAVAIAAARDYARQKAMRCHNCRTYFKTTLHRAGKGGYFDVECQCGNAQVDLETQVRIKDIAAWTLGDENNFSGALSRGLPPVCPGDGGYLRVFKQGIVGTRKKAEVECLLCGQSTTIEY